MVSPNNDQEPSFPVLVKQDSLNNLSEALHKFHTQEEEPVFIQNLSSSSSSSSPPIVLTNSLLKGTSSSSSSCKRSIDHVWNEMFPDNATNNNMCFQEELAIGDRTASTFEQVLVRDGINNDQHSMAFSPQPLIAIDPMAISDSSSFKVPEIGNYNYLDNHQLLGFPAMPLQYERKRLRSTNETMEKSVERRQRRMIKNRESAARSRARKQAYTNMLEDQVSELRRRKDWLTNRNHRLKQLKEAELALDSGQPAAPRYQLRRTSSATF